MSAVAGGSRDFTSGGMPGLQAEEEGVRETAKNLKNRDLVELLKHQRKAITDLSGDVRSCMEELAGLDGEVKANKQKDLEECGKKLLAVAVKANECHRELAERITKLDEKIQPKTREWVFVTLDWMGLLYSLGMSIAEINEPSGEFTWRTISVAAVLALSTGARGLNWLIQRKRETAVQEQCYLEQFSAIWRAIDDATRLGTFAVTGKLPKKTNPAEGVYYRGIEEIEEKLQKAFKNPSERKEAIRLWENRIEQLGASIEESESRGEPERSVNEIATLLKLEEMLSNLSELFDQKNDKGCCRHLGEKSLAILNMLAGPAAAALFGVGEYANSLSFVWSALAACVVSGATDRVSSSIKQTQESKKFLNSEVQRLLGLVQGWLGHDRRERCLSKEEGVEEAERPAFPAEEEPVRSDSKHRRLHSDYCRREGGDLESLLPVEGGGEDLHLPGEGSSGRAVAAVHSETSSEDEGAPTEDKTVRVTSRHERRRSKREPSRLTNLEKEEDDSSVRVTSRASRGNEALDPGATKV